MGFATSTAATSAASQLADQNRWGLLGKASVLSVTSYPHRTSPTIRGKWLLENILAAPVPPPPPDVNTALDEGKTVKATSVREMLEHHRANPACASCHANMDPLGFALENFDSIGQWRTKDGESPIDASGRAAGRHEGRRPRGASRRAAAAEGSVREGGHRQAADVCARPRDRLPRRAGDSRDRRAAAPPDDYRWSSTILAIVEKHAISDAQVKDHDHYQKKPFPGAPCFAASARPCRFRCSTR